MNKVYSSKDYFRCSFKQHKSKNQLAKAQKKNAFKKQKQLFRDSINKLNKF